jgi:hypothetical protein
VLKVKCRLKVAKADRGNPDWIFYQWRGTFEMSEAGEGKPVIASSAPQGEEGHTTDTAARAKAQSAGEEALAREAEAKIGQYIFGRN